MEEFDKVLCSLNLCAYGQILSQCSGFIDIEKISPDAWPAIVADISSGDQSIMALAFGTTCFPSIF